MTSGRYQLMRGPGREGLSAPMRSPPSMSGEVRCRKLPRSPNAQMSAIRREAVLAYLALGRRL